MVVCSGAAVVSVQAFHSARNRWTICFLSIALVFNPAIPVLQLANWLGLVAIVLAAAACAHVFQRHVDGEIGDEELGAALDDLNERRFGPVSVSRNGRP